MKQVVPIPLFGSEPLQLPVHTTLDALVMEEDRPAARLIQILKLPEQQVAFGPFGASGAANLSADGQTIYLMSLDTGWPVKTDGVTAIRLGVAAQARPRAVDERLEMHILMDDEALSPGE